LTVTLLRWIFRLGALAALVWFAVMIPLGKRTLWGHLCAIWATPEAQELKEGTREEAGKVAERIRGGIGGKPGETTPAEAPPAAAPEQLGERDRRALDRLVDEKTRSGRTAKAPSPRPRSEAVPREIGERRR
jgi:hypothetical protein